MAAVYGTLSEFDSTKHDFRAWVTKYDAYASLNKITDDTDKVNLFLSALTTETTALLRTLCTPDEPTTKTIKELKDKLQNHLDPKPSKRMERVKFRERFQTDEETIPEYVAALKQLSTHCEFANLEEEIIDQLCLGAKEKAIRVKLGTMKTLTYSDCIETATVMERSAKDANRVPAGSTPTINYAKGNSNSARQQQMGDSRQGDKARRCWRCGRKNHLPSDCFFKDKTCNSCNKVGHISPTCEQVQEFLNKKTKGKTQKPPNSTQKNYFSVEEALLDLNLDLDFNSIQTDSVNFIKPFSFDLLVNGVTITFQEDSGSPIGTISENDLHKYGFDKSKMLKTEISFSDYVGIKLEPIGYFKVNVVCNRTHVTQDLDLYVFQNGGPPLAGRAWLVALGLKQNILHFSSSLADNVIAKYQEVFTDTIGRYKLEAFPLYLKPNAKPIFLKPRPLPFAIRDKVTAELQRLLENGLISPVTSSEWGTPIVPIVKPDGSIRICGDYKVTLNKYLDVDRYPVPRIQDVLSNFKPGKRFCKLDLSQAYLQLELMPNYKKLTTISTHMGLFVWNRLPYGVSSAPGIFARVIAGLFKDVPWMASFFDDSAITGDDDNELQERLEIVLQRLKEVGLVLKKKKCKLFVDTIDFLGYEISAEGIKIPEARTKAIQNLPTPTNVAEVKTFLGLVSHYSKFVPRLATLANPLYALTRKEVPWKFGPLEKKAVEAIKVELLSDKILIAYNDKLPLVLTTDASPVGISAVLAHKCAEGLRPVAYASRTLTAAEKNYAQIDREALAVVFGVKYFHQYLYGRKFTLRTDNRALTFIFKEDKPIPVMSAQRVQRYAIFLAGYNYRIEHVRAAEIPHVDALSRLPMKARDSINPEGIDKAYINCIFENVRTLADLDIAHFTQHDTVLKQVFDRILHGEWPTKEDELPLELRPYYRKRDELNIEEGCLMWGHRMIVPESLRAAILKELHSTHMGVVKMKSTARGFIYWPGMDSDIERISQTCHECIAMRNEPPKSALHSWPWPDGPAHRVHLDFAGPVGSHMYIIIIDAYSKWTYVKRVQNITSTKTIKILRDYFSLWGIPITLVTDNGPSLVSEEMEKFLKDNGVIHIRTPPYHPASNGAAENSVKTFKNFLKKVGPNQNMDILDEAICKFILKYNSTVHCTTGTSPAELHLGRKLLTDLDRVSPKFRVLQRMVQQKIKAAANFKGTRQIEFDVNDDVYLRNYGRGDKFIPGQIEKKLSPVTYEVRTGESVTKRHVDQLYPKRVTGLSEIANQGTVAPSSPRRSSQAGETMLEARIPDPSPSQIPVASPEISVASSENSVTSPKCSVASPKRQVESTTKTGAPLRVSQRAPKPVKRLIEEM